LEVLSFGSPGGLGVDDVGDGLMLSLAFELL